MPSSPRTPTRRRKSSSTSINISFTSTSPQSNGYLSKRGSVSRRSSQYSISSPLTPRPTSSYDRGADYGMANGVESEISNGFGSLADELAEAFDEDEGEEMEEEAPEVGNYDARNERNGIPPLDHNGTTPQSTRERSLSPPKQSVRSKHHRRQTSQYDGSDYGDESDLEGADGISPALEARMAAIEGLARRGTESNGSDFDDVVRRVIDRLKDLGSQLNIENGASRLITTHAALTSHLSNQTRAISTLTHPIISPLAPLPDPDFVEDILPLLTSLMSELPIPATQPLSSLHSLHASTAELTTLLTSLSDTLHMTRQTTSLASRRLRSATEMVVELRREAEAREEGIRWLEKGNWERRLAEREGSRVCGEIIGGFEEACNIWRERLLDGLEVGAA